ELFAVAFDYEDHLAVIAIRERGGAGEACPFAAECMGVACGGVCVEAAFEELAAGGEDVWLLGESIGRGLSPADLLLERLRVGEAELLDCLRRFRGDDVLRRPAKREAFGDQVGEACAFTFTSGRKCGEELWRFVSVQPRRDGIEQQARLQ